MNVRRTAPLGHVDDQYLDHTRYDEKTAPNVGRKSEPGGPEYKAFDLVGDKPQFMNREVEAAGVHTSEVSRKLVTGSPFDIQFSDLNAAYGFGFAAFDNAQVRHAVHYGALYLRFAK